jgi:crotonobetainyl-CoA:carnitine CoA-transferase CaiB-like acyl-CoA transferase
MRAYPELFASLSANKRSIVLDLKSDGDRARALELAAAADVMIEGFRPGVAARLGVAYDDARVVNPSIVYCSVSGMGQSGPLALAPGHDANYQAWAAALAPDGGAPVVSRLPIADLAGGMAAAFAICAALVRQVRRGQNGGREGDSEGEYIDVAMSDVLATWTGAATPRATGVASGARSVPGYGTFATRDGGYVALGVITELHFWQGLCTVLALDDVSDVAFVERMERGDQLQALVAGAIARRDRDELVDALLAADVPVSAVLTRREMLALPHFIERGVSTSDPWADPSIGYPVQFAQHPYARVTPPPEVDEHRGAAFFSA